MKSTTAWDAEQDTMQATAQAGAQTGAHDSAHDFAHDPAHAPVQDSDERRQAVRRWALTEESPPWRTPGSVLQWVRFQGQPAVLKVALSAEERRGAALLRWWNGVGAVRVLAQHGAALLLERAQGGVSLVSLSQTGQDDEACRILCAAAKGLHRRAGATLPAMASPKLAPPELVTSERASPNLVSPELVPLEQVFRSLTAASTQGGIFEEAHATARALLAAPRQATALHGDLHHGNVLDAGSRGWLVIDPKGYVGERAFDFANIFCNPDHATATQPRRFARRVEVVAAEARLEPARLLAWIAAWAGLSAAWHREDGSAPDTALAVAALALGALHR